MENLDAKVESQLPVVDVLLNVEVAVHDLCLASKKDAEEGDVCVRVCRLIKVEQ